MIDNDAGARRRQRRERREAAERIVMAVPIGESTERGDPARLAANALGVIYAVAEVPRALRRAGRAHCLECLVGDLLERAFRVGFTNGRRSAGDVPLERTEPAVLALRSEAMRLVREMGRR